MTEEAKQKPGGFAYTSKIEYAAWGIPASLCGVGGRLRKVEGSVCHDCYAQGTTGSGKFKLSMYGQENVKKANLNRFETFDKDPKAWAENMSVGRRAVPPSGRLQEAHGRAQTRRCSSRKGDLRGVMSFDRIVIIGVGLLGASFARAVKTRNICRTIGGYSRNTETLERAHKKGILDHYSAGLISLCRDADLILLATPLGTFRQIASQLGRSLRKGALMTDVGSVKGRLVYDLESLMPDGVHYVASHPIAGSERSGMHHAQFPLADSLGGHSLATCSINSSTIDLALTF